ncbi:RES domain-containing protein [Roseateles flavus]|uniref:RES domain-containing protein n=1 Tax=Roseateles flavus TaxID=3149041 RepID=A0ABV0GLN0_9BURK
MTNAEEDKPAGKRLCINCIGEAYLSTEVGVAGEEGECDYCGDTAPSISIDDLVERVEQAFTDHYARTATNPDSWEERLMADRESSYCWERDGFPVREAIQDAAGLDEEAAADVLEILEAKHALHHDKDNLGEESEFSSDAHYKRRQPNGLGLYLGWHEFEQSLKTRARFFSSAGEELLARVFSGIDKIKTLAGRPLVLEAGPTTPLDHLYRARVFQSDRMLEAALCRPDYHLASPPPRIARAGRMNAQGISVFYGATREDVAIAEVRPPVGSRVAVARFEIARSLRLLDLTAASEAHEDGSIFDPSFKERLARAAFLRSLGARMVRPVMPDDETIDYLPTQAVADYLATANEPRLDGIVFPSAQVEEGRNIVLFNHAARVEELAFPKGTAIHASTGHNGEDGWETEYYVREIFPLRENRQADPIEDGVLGGFPHSTPPPDHDADYRDAALRIMRDTVKVHHVNWVRVGTTSFDVARHRSERRDLRMCG